MDAGTSYGDTSIAPAPSILMEDCLKLLRGESDSQRLAGLLLVTKVCNKDDHSAILQVYQAVGSQFLLRLLRTGLGKSQGGKEGENSDAYLELSVSILAAFCRVPEIAASPEMLPVVPLLLQILSKGSYPSMNEDCYEFIYLVINAQEDGVRTLFESEGIQLLASQIPSLSDGSPVQKIAMELVQLMISKLPTEEIYSKHPFEMALLVVAVAQKFGLLHTDLKFKALHLLSGILCSEHSAPVRDALRSMNDSVWSSNMRAGVVAILNSRVAPADKLQALFLAECSISIVGEGWLIDPVELPEVKDPIPASRCIQLVFETSRVEIAVLLNDLAYLRDEAYKNSASSLETVIVKSRNLAVMFSLIESVIKLISKFEEDEESPPNAALSDSILMNIISGLDKTISVVLEYLQDAKEHGQNKGDDLLASVRIIGRYLAETPDACRDKVKELLSYMVSVQGKDEPYPFYSTCFLLPMLCQITMSIDGCELFVSSSAYRAVIEYLISLIGSGNNAVEDNGGVYLACDTLLNFLLKGERFRSQIVDGLPCKLLGALSRWGMETDEDSSVLMAGSICALILDSTSEKALQQHPEFNTDDMSCLPQLVKKSLTIYGKTSVTDDDTKADADLHQIVAAGYSRWAGRFPSIQKVIEVRFGQMGI